ncbi:hypothetical protein F4553_000062 [Allocatelliglobosispora scoriae]|uniref:Uncharacterized protein n=1 Tax=Allocatelliglobosispora scoriae TaxID=643052 RepID=A0A841BHZ9_9ACTN|nr:hypothetical protein [Allocatelliglobosispora scoriae]
MTPFMTGISYLPHRSNYRRPGDALTVVSLDSLVRS